eukprot:symbB.v1.2.018714.t1/scaffold1475.1/size116674/4
MKSVSSDAEFTSETLQDPFAWRKMASGMLSEMPPLDDTNEDLIFFEPVVETLSDIANDDQEELPKGIGRSERAQMPNMGPVQRRSCLEINRMKRMSTVNKFSDSGLTSRVVLQAAGERNFHVFYQLLQGSTEEQRQKHRLRERPEDYAMLRGGGVLQVDGVDDGSDWQRVLLAFQAVGADQEMLDGIMDMLSATLLCGEAGTVFVS